MKVLVAGATGAIGRQLVPALVSAGHQVHGITRRTSKRNLLLKFGAVPLVADALNRQQVIDAVASAKPD
jgi:nucleoside-diphosphate-sugar epimerase